MQEELQSLLRQYVAEALPFEALVKAYQEIYGLRIDGKLGPVTAEHLQQSRYCAVPDRLPQGTARARWDNTNWTGTSWRDGRPRALELTYFVPPIPGISQEQADHAAATGLSWWSDVAALRFAQVTNPQKANLVGQVGTIDGPGQTLAWFYLPMGRETSESQLKGMFDRREQWTDKFFTEVWAHELGHGIGLEHGGNGLMAPFHQAGARLDDWCIREVQLRYGPRVEADVPTDPVPGQHIVNIGLQGIGDFSGVVKKVG